MSRSDYGPPALAHNTGSLVRALLLCAPAGSAEPHAGTPCPCSCFTCVLPWCAHSAKISAGDRMKDLLTATDSKAADWWPAGHLGIWVQGARKTAR